MSLEALKAVKRAFLNDERWDMTEIGQMVNEAIEKAEKREWVGLTDEDIDYFCYLAHFTHEEELALAVEAKLKEKNGFAEEKNT